IADRLDRHSHVRTPRCELTASEAARRVDPEHPGDHLARVPPAVPARRLKTERHAGLHIEMLVAVQRDRECALEHVQELLALVRVLTTASLARFDAEPLRLEQRRGTRE